VLHSTGRRDLPRDDPLRALFALMLVLLLMASLVVGAWRVVFGH
jgi:hypothetical protein